MAATNFWTSPNKDPKRAYRFIVDLASGAGVTGFVNGATWYASKADKPKFTVTETPHKYINHTFHYPGRVEWENVTITLVDPTEPSAAAAVAEILEKSGYQIPGSATAAESTTTINKAAATNALGNVTITQIGENPTDELEKWTLRNAWIQQANFSQLDYDSDDLSTIELVLRYDWAELQTVAGPATDNFFKKV